MKKRYIIEALLVTLLVVAGGFYFINKHRPSSANPYIVKPGLPTEVIVTLDKNGFTPKLVTIKQGMAIRWKNVSGEKQTVNSDDHPTHQLHRELNFGLFNNGSTVVYVFKKPGTYRYHNHLKPDQKGTIDVEK